jgi:hypothetical protein
VTTDVVARKLGDGGYLLQARPPWRSLGSL